MKADHYKDWHR